MIIPFHPARMKGVCVLHAGYRFPDFCILPGGNFPKANLIVSVRLPIFFFVFSSKNIKTNTASSLAIISHKKEHFTLKEIRSIKFENEDQYFRLKNRFIKAHSI